jgi:broad specificity phosphatase PhoE
MGPMATDTNSTPRIVAYFVRHGQTTLNAEGRFRGPADPSLDDIGFKDGNKLSAYFQNTEIGEAWSSDKLRAVQTAEAILDPKGQVANQTPDLRALNVGCLSGEKKDELDNKAMVEYHQDHPDDAFINGESLNDFRKRVRPVILRAIHAGYQSGKPSMVVAHSSIIHELGNVVHNDHTKTIVKPGGVAAVTWDGKHFDANPLIRPADKKDAYAA